jgi:hypothetical protein
MGVRIYELVYLNLNDYTWVNKFWIKRYEKINFNLLKIINIFETNDIIKMDTYEHQTEHFSVGVDL